MKFNPSLKHNLRKINEDYVPDDKVISWLKDYLKDVKRGEGWVDIDKVVYDADIELGVDLSGKEKELAAYIKKIGGGSLLKESKKLLKEAKLDYGNRYEFDTIGGKPEVTIIGNEVHMGCWSSGAKVFTSDEFQKKLDAAGERGEYYKAVQEVQDAINKELLKAMNRFDNDVKAILKKYGFK